MGDLIFWLLFIGSIVLAVYIIKGEIKKLGEPKRFNELLGKASGGDVVAIGELIPYFRYYSVYAKSKKLRNFLAGLDNREARAMILMAMEEHLCGSKKSGLEVIAANSFKDKDTVALVREFVESFYEKYGEESNGRLIEMLTSKNLQF